MPIYYKFTDKNRDYRTYRTVYDDDGNNYSKILFHKVKWKVCDKPDIADIQDIWAEDIIQSIIDGNMQGEFEVIIEPENDVEEYAWLVWEIMTAWSGEI